MAHGENPPPEAVIAEVPSLATRRGVADEPPRASLLNRMRHERRYRRLQRKLAGRIVDMTFNHGEDRRFYSRTLCQFRDMYVYLPPCYDPNQAYSLVLWFHGAFGDETAFLECCQLETLDKLIHKGVIPPMIVACPDCTYEGVGRLGSQHSFLVNGLGGRYEDFILADVLPLLRTQFSLRPEREAHATGGVSGGGFGALSLAMKHRDIFGACAVLAAPVNMRYSTTSGRYFRNFRPETFRWQTEYNPRMVAGRFYGVIALRTERLIGRVFGPDEVILENVQANNPADLLFSEDIKPGELAIYINYPSHDNFNFDAHAESFVWLAAQQGIEVDVERIGLAAHLTGYFRRNHDNVYEWLGARLLPPVTVATSREEQADDPPALIDPAR